MKTLSLFMLLILSLTSFASDTCLKRICKGDYVSDKWGWRGEVVDFAMEDGLVYVDLGNNPRPWAFHYEELYKYTRCMDGLCVGDVVVDRQGETGRLVEIYEQGLCFVLDAFGEGPYPYFIDQLSRQ